MTRALIVILAAGIMFGIVILAIAAWAGSAGA